MSQRLNKLATSESEMSERKWEVVTGFVEVVPKREIDEGGRQNTVNWLVEIVTFEGAPATSS